MIDLATIKTTAKNLIVDVMHLNAAQVKFRDESEGSSWSQDPTVWLRLSAFSQIGDMEWRPAYPLANQDAVVTYVTQKTFTLSVRAESFSQDWSDTSRHAGLLLETLKTRLQRWSSTLRLAGIFAIVDYKPTKFLSYVSDDRQVDAYIMDLICATADADVDDSTDAGQWINEVIVDGQVSGIARAYEDIILADGPVLFYRLNDAAGALGPTDSSISELAHGLWIHSELIAHVPSILPVGGQDEAALQASNVLAQFDSVLSPSAPGVTNFTIEWWLTPTAFGTDYNSVGPGDGVFYCEGKPGGDIAVGTNSDATIMTIPGFYTLNVLHHIVYTYDGTYGKIWRNGQFVQAKAQSTPAYSGVPASWGPCPDGNWFGTFANMALYPAVLSNDQILAHYRAGTVGNAIHEDVKGS